MKAMLEMVPLGWMVDAVLGRGAGVRFICFFRKYTEKGEGDVTEVRTYFYDRGGCPVL